MKKSKWIGPLGLEHLTQSIWEILSTPLNASFDELNLTQPSTYPVKLVKTTGYKCKTIPNPNFLRADYHTRAVESESKIWMYKLREELGVESGPRVHPTMRQCCKGL